MINNQKPDPGAHYCDIAIIGAGIIGIATAYYLKQLAPNTSVILLDAAEPMALTSAHSGENYRNWWPHPVMTAFTDRSIDLMEELTCGSENLINMNRRGYALCTRNNDPDVLLKELGAGYSRLEGNTIRFHDGAAASTRSTYKPPDFPDWQIAPSGVDVISDRNLIRQTFPSIGKDINTVVHIRRAGSISGHSLGTLMLAGFKRSGGIRVQADVSSVVVSNGFQIQDDQSGTMVHAERLVNAAGPFINDIAGMLNTSLPVTNTLQQKIAFEDKVGAIPRDMPFAIDLDPQHIDWTEEEIEDLSASDEFKWLTELMPGAIHCRPEGGDRGSWLKLGWAFNESSSAPSRAPPLFGSFPEIVLRGAARLNPALKNYYGQLPRSLHHYGGYYTLTDENWPLIGPMATEGAFVVGALSGFGTMAACAAGDLCARQMLDTEVPDYGYALSPQRYEDKKLMTEIAAISHKGIL